MTNCLTNLVKIKDLCDCANDSADQYYFHQFVNGITYQWLSDLSSLGGYKTGIAFGDDLVANAENKLFAQLQLLQGEGQTINKIADNFCNSCDFAQVMQMANSGVTITRVGQSKNMYTQISSLRIKSDYTGTTNVIIDDGIAIMAIPVTLTAGAIDTINVLNYKTYSNSIKIYLQNAAINLFKVDCPVSSGCGCSGGGAAKPKMFSISGLAVGADQYGFQPCIIVGCDNSNIICNAVNGSKAIMAQYLAYEIGINILESMLLNTNLVETKLKLSSELLASKLSALITEKDMLLYGRKAGHNLSKTLGIADIMQSFMKSGNDECLLCNGIIQKVTASF